MVIVRAHPPEVSWGCLPWPARHLTPAVRLLSTTNSREQDGPMACWPGMAGIGPAEEWRARAVGARETGRRGGGEALACAARVRCRRAGCRSAAAPPGIRSHGAVLGLCDPAVRPPGPVSGQRHLSARRPGSAGRQSEGSAMRRTRPVRTRRPGERVSQRATTELSHLHLYGTLDLYTMDNTLSTIRPAR